MNTINEVNQSQALEEIRENSQNSALRQLIAWHSGSVRSRREFLPIPIIPRDDTLITAFVRVAGENTPCGIAYGYAHWDHPIILSIPEPREKAAVARMVLKWGQVILEHLAHPSLGGGRDEDAFKRQLWLPGSSHIAMLQLIAYSFSYLRKGHPEEVEELRRIGRACTFLFKEAMRPGQITVIDGSALLRNFFDIPADELRQQHLGYNLAWIETSGGRREKVAAAETAWKESISTTLDPVLESKELFPRVHEYRGHSPESSTARRLAGEIRQILEEELSRRWQITLRGRNQLIEGRRENPELYTALKLSEDEFNYQYQGTERRLLMKPESFLPNPETDFNPRAAAARFFQHNYSQELIARSLVHGDEQLLNETIAKGEALRGRIVGVWNEGEGKRTKPVWRIRSRSSQKLSLRDGHKVCVAGFPKRIAVIREISVSGADRFFELEIVALKTRPKNSPEIPDARDCEALLNSEVTFVKVAPGYHTHSKSIKVWDDTVPGAWLTHAAAPQPPSNENYCQSNLVDFVERLGGA